MGLFDQSDYEVRFEWGEKGVEALAPISDFVIIVDVLSFSTSVDISTSQGATVFPYSGEGDAVDQYARSVNAEVADRRNSRGHSLAPSTLESLPPDYRMVLPSLNGSQLSMIPDRSTVIAGCLRNATAVAAAVSSLGKTVAVIACGERWEDRRSIRPCLEDMLGAGAILSRLPGSRSAEAEGAIAVFERMQGHLIDAVTSCGSGQEKVRDGKERDIHLAADLDSSAGVPVLQDGAYVALNRDLRG